MGFDHVIPEFITKILSQQKKGKLILKFKEVEMKLDHLFILMISSVVLNVFLIMVRI